MVCLLIFLLGITDSFCGVIMQLCPLCGALVSVSSCRCSQMISKKTCGRNYWKMTDVIIDAQLTFDNYVSGKLIYVASKNKFYILRYMLI
jgi:hypothetical protein